MSALATKMMTAEEFALRPKPANGSREELVRGEVVTMPPPSFRHGEIQLAIGSELRAYVRAHKLGRVTVESGVKTDEDPDTVRGPDVAFWGVVRLPVGTTPLVYAEFPADLVVEVLSPSNSHRKMATKVREYLEHGTRLVWVVDPHERNVTVYRKAGEGRLLWEAATIDGEDVLPGFECQVSEFFAEG